LVLVQAAMETGLCLHCRTWIPRLRRAGGSSATTLGLRRLRRSICFMPRRRTDRSSWMNLWNSGGRAAGR